MMKRIILIIIIAAINIFSIFSNDVIDIPKSFSLSENVDWDNINEIDNRIYLFQLLDFNNDNLNDILFIFKIDNKENYIYIYALYKNLKNKLELIDKHIEYDIPLDGLLCWNSDAANKIQDKYLIELKKFQFKLLYPTSSYLDNKFLKNHFILIFLYTDSLDYWIITIENEKIKKIVQIGELKFIIENEKLFFITANSNDYLNMDNNVFSYNYKCYIYQENLDTFTENKKLSNSNINLIYDNYINSFNKNLSIDSLFELFFFLFYNDKQILNKEWLNKMILKIPVRNNRLKDISSLMIKRLELNDSDFSKYLLTYTGAYPQ